MEVKLKLKLDNGIEIELSDKQAKELKSILDGIYNQPINWINTPIIIERWRDYFPNWSYPVITCNNDNSNNLVTMSLNNI